VKIKRLGHWTRDYLYAVQRGGNAFIFRKPPSHYLGHIEDTKPPIILIPGIFEKWHFLQAIADPLSLKGHPVYALEHLGYNTKAIPGAAKLVRELIDEKNLRDIIIIAHSKGGLIGKYLLAFCNHDNRVKKVIAIATPFGGSRPARFILGEKFKELSPDGETIQKLHRVKGVNDKIVSIFGIFDNHIWPESSSRLEGAENIQVEAYGHHRILNNKKVIEIIVDRVR